MYWLRLTLMCLMNQNGFKKCELYHTFQRQKTLTLSKNYVKIVKRGEMYANNDSRLMAETP